MMSGQELNSQRIFNRLAMALIRLRVCAGWSEPLLFAHTTFLEISCHGSSVLSTSKKNENRLVLFTRINSSFFIADEWEEDPNTIRQKQRVNDPINWMLA